MIIRCPQCEHSRSITESKIPATAELATCPRCKHRFRFRTLHLPDALQEEGAAPDADAHQERSAGQRRGKRYPEADFPMPEVHRPQSAFRESAEQSGTDIWDAVDALHQRWQTQIDQPVANVDYPGQTSAHIPPHVSETGDMPPPRQGGGREFRSAPPETEAMPDAAVAAQRQKPAKQASPAPVSGWRALLFPKKSPEPADSRKTPDTTPEPADTRRLAHTPVRHDDGQSDFPIGQQAEMAPASHDGQRHAHDGQRAAHDGQRHAHDEQRHAPSPVNSRDEHAQHSAADGPLPGTAPRPASLAARPAQAERPPLHEAERPPLPEAEPSPQANATSARKRVCPENPEAEPSPQPSATSTRKRVRPENVDLEDLLPEHHVPPPAGSPVGQAVFPYAEDGPPPEARVEHDLQMLRESVHVRPTRDLGRLREFDSPQAEADARAHEEAVCNEIPWENTAKYGWIRGFMTTLGGAMFRASSFYPQITDAGSLAPGYLFFLLLGYVTILSSLVWGQAAVMLVPEASIPFTGRVALPMLLLLAPVALGLMLLFVAGFIRICLLLFAPDKAGFIRIYKIVSYSVAPFVLSVVPFVGPPIGALWFVASLIAGCRNALSLPWLLAVLTPLPPAAMLLAGLVWYFL